MKSYDVEAHIRGGFFSALIDTSFTEWVTLRVAGVVYGAGMILWAVICLVFFGLLWAYAGAWGLLSFIVGVPVFWFLGVLILRLSFEASIATIAIAKNTEVLKR